MSPKLTGRRCQCAACGLLFKTVNTFDVHRVGASTDRRCLTAAELQAKGYAPNAAGFWRQPMTPEQQQRRCAA